MSPTEKLQVRAAHRSFRKLHRSRRARGLIIGSLVAVILPGVCAPVDPVLADVPAYAEEWTVPNPQDVDVDPFGRVWVTSFDDSVRVFTAAGGVLLFAFGGSGAGDGEFQNPYGIGFDPGGDAYICDYAGARVEKFASDGTFLLSWPIPSNRSDHVAVDEAGDVYVSGYSDLSVHKYAADGTPLADWPSAGGTYTSGVIVTGSTLHVVQWDLPVVEQFSLDGDFLGSFAAQTVNGTDIEVDALGQLWVTDYGGNEVRVFLADGTPLDVLGGPGSGPGEFNGAQGVGIGLDGSIYVADEGNSRVQRFGPPVTAIPAEDGVLPGSGTLLTLYPNPCRGGTRLQAVLPRTDVIRLTISDVRGRTIATLADGFMASGRLQFGWNARQDDGRPAPSGVYFARLALGTGEVKTAKLQLVR